MKIFLKIVTNDNNEDIAKIFTYDNNGNIAKICYINNNENIAKIVTLLIMKILLKFYI